jgi:hypothetical protein
MPLVWTSFMNRNRLSTTENIEEVRLQLTEKRRLLIRLNRECMLAEEWLLIQNAMQLARTTPRIRYQQGYTHGIMHEKPQSREKDYMRGFKAARKSHKL